jgi:hypothetical protein
MGFFHQKLKKFGQIRIFAIKLSCFGFVIPLSYRKAKACKTGMALAVKKTG